MPPEYSDRSYSSSTLSLDAPQATGSLTEAILEDFWTSAGMFPRALASAQGVIPPNFDLLREPCERLDSSREQVYQTCLGNKGPWMVGICQEQGRAVIFQPRCKNWRCDVCGPINAGYFTAQAAYGTKVLYSEGKGLYFLTLTSRGDVSPEQAFYIGSRAWRLIKQTANRRNPAGEYFGVLELQERGHPHWHFLETWGLGTRFWKDTSARFGLGYMADEREVTDIDQAARYVIGYLFKTLRGPPLPKNTRRVRQSRGFPRLPPPDLPEGWNFCSIPAKESLLVTQIRLKQSGYEVAWLDSQTAWDYVNPGNGS